jgi:uncharacterized coiled-coil protein SlyX
MSLSWWDVATQRHWSLDTRVAALEARVAVLEKLEKTMAIDLTKLTTEVSNNSTVTASVVALVNLLSAEIKAIPPSTDPTTQAALDVLTSTLAANDNTIAAAVTANTTTPTNG